MNAFATGQTHYVPAFTSRSRGLSQTVCGIGIDMAEHSVTPSCPTCKAWLEQDAADAKEIAAALDAEDAAMSGCCVDCHAPILPGDLRAAVGAYQEVCAGCFALRRAQLSLSL